MLKTIARGRPKQQSARGRWIHLENKLVENKPHCNGLCRKMEIKSDKPEVVLLGMKDFSVLNGDASGIRTKNE